MKIPKIDVDADIDVVLWPNRYLLTVMGTWPTNKSVNLLSRLFIYFRILLSMSLLVSVIIGSYFSIKINWGDLDLFTEIGCIGLQMVLIVFKYVYVIIRRRNFTEVYETLSELWSLVKNQEERDGLMEYAYTAKMITFAFFGLCIGDLVVFTFASIAINYFNYKQSNGTHYHKSLPFDLWYGVDIQKSPNFEILFGVQVMFMLVCVFSISGYDGTLTTIVLHATGQFRLISVKFTAIGRKLRANGYQSLQSRNSLSEELGQCIKLHQRVLRLSEDLDKLLGPLIFIQVMLAAIEICLTGYAVIDGESSGVNLMKYSFYLVSVVVQLSIWCWPGELIITESTAISDKVFYEIPWTMLPIERQRDLALVIFRSQKQCQLTALGLQVACLGKITEVVKTGSSYMALLRSIRDK